MLLSLNAESVLFFSSFFSAVPGPFGIPLLLEDVSVNKNILWQGGAKCSMEKQQGFKAALTTMGAN